VDGRLRPAAAAVGVVLHLNAAVGMSVFVTPSVGVGTALVGDFATSARIYRRGGLSVEATNSHDDWFVRNLSMIRAEERLALAVFRPSAFCSVTTLT
jgi:HK97 family phage major capsid protein